MFLQGLRVCLHRAVPDSSATHCSRCSSTVKTEAPVGALCCNKPLSKGKQRPWHLFEVVERTLDSTGSITKIFGERCEHTRTPTLSAQPFHVCCVWCSSSLFNANPLTSALPVLNPRKQTIHSHACFLFFFFLICITFLVFPGYLPLALILCFDFLQTADREPCSLNPPSLLQASSSDQLCLCTYEDPPLTSFSHSLTPSLSLFHIHTCEDVYLSLPLPGGQAHPCGFTQTQAVCCKA